MVYLELIVHPRHRRRGIGSRLLEEVYAAARRHDRSLIEIGTVCEHCLAALPATGPATATSPTARTSPA